MKIVLTGFEPFGRLDRNPAQFVLREMAERAQSCGWDDLVTEILPTEFDAAGKRIAALIHEVQPEAVLSFGAAAGSRAILLERVALNLDDANVPDNAGVLRTGRLIVPDGPLAYWSSLPIDRLQEALASAGIPVQISNHAGTYICNHVFYVARHTLEQIGSDAPCGFIHVPLMTEQVASPDSPSLPLSVMVAAVEQCLDVLRSVACSV